MSASVEVPLVDMETQLTPYFVKPYYKSFRQQCRRFLQDVILPNIDKWEKNGSLPKWVYAKAYEYGIYTPDYPNQYGGQEWQQQPFDYFMDIIRQDELGKAASGGLFTSLYIHKISVPPVLHFGTEAQKQMFVPVLKGEKIAALAISEPQYGSDVSNIAAKAVKDASGQYYVVNGMKKWISNGIKADYYVTAVRTGAANSGLRGVSLLIIPRAGNEKSIITSRINTQGHKISETAMIIFRNARVPVSCLIGKENQGFKLIMYNFNRERLGITITANALAKCAFAEACHYAKVRKTFGKPLSKHQVIRHKLAEMARSINSTQAFIEKLAYQLATDPLSQSNVTLSANICLCKVAATKGMEFVAREASQIMGGASYVLGKKVDRVYRDVRALAIYGGSEEIMLDVSVRLALKSASSTSLHLPYVDWENQAAPSAYYTDAHRNFRARVAKFVDTEILPYVDKWEKQWNVPLSVYRKAYECGVYAARYPTEYGGTDWAIDGAKWDQFFNMILYEQLARAGSGGIFSSLFIQTISIPPVIHFGTHAQKQLFMPVIRGEKIAALAISEPQFGSDVANLSCRAVRDPNDASYFLVNGMKKWISNGTQADFFVAAVRTGAVGSGAKGISLLIIPKQGNEKNIVTSRILTQGHHTSHTAMIIFKNARVPVSYLIGKENQGFRLIMYNFNQERFAIACQAVQLSRVAFQESVKYAKIRKTFGKALIEHQVIRHKLAEMARRIMTSFCYMEKVAFALQNDPLAQSDKSIPANIALFKVDATKMLEFVAREASQIFGGASYVEGKIVDRIYRDVRAFAIYGGSEEIMLDVSTRLAKL
eukprot:CAMPEP_0202690186 /NCGR_PEP_ID=MMETSP1385-20130828/5254_1 /ASSEMBLY_ACC=CAM_ASM_000861 /TAXON_ID=933848 /ORGANISM="Elphidium margaritaceum" /LENGTH=824 /DNA_ID=CAMNT_0049345421 /DNA_START=30 /DNA_END=2504 /DNA_ORIENTATION=+